MSKQEQGIGFAVTALVLGIIAFLTGFLFVGPFLGVLALIFGIIALNKNTLKPMSIVGIVLGSLAIVFGTIFLITFLALPALQQSQRDTALKNDVATIASAVTTFESDNQGTLPTTGDLINQDLSLSEEDNGGDRITVVAYSTDTISPSSGAIVVVTGSSCGTSSTSAQGLIQSAPRSYSVVVKLEAAGGLYYCQSN